MITSALQSALLFLDAEPTPDLCETFPPACITDFSTITDVLLPLIYGVAALILLAMLIYAAITIIRAGGDPENIDKAKKTITYAIIGAVVVFTAFLVTRLIFYILDVPFLL